MGWPTGPGKEPLETWPSPRAGPPQTPQACACGFQTPDTICDCVLRRCGGLELLKRRVLGKGLATALNARPSPTLSTREPSAVGGLEAGLEDGLLVGLKTEFVVVVVVAVGGGYDGPKACALQRFPCGFIEGGRAGRSPVVQLPASSSGPSRARPSSVHRPGLRNVARWGSTVDETSSGMMERHQDQCCSTPSSSARCASNRNAFRK
jgi:hypothetical protein